HAHGAARALGGRVRGPRPRRAARGLLPPAAGPRAPDPAPPAPAHAPHADLRGGPAAPRPVRPSAAGRARGAARAVAHGAARRAPPARGALLPAPAARDGPPHA